MTTNQRMPSTEVLGAERTRSAVATAAPVVDAEFSEAPPRHLRDYLWVLYKYRWLAATCFALTLGGAVLVTALSPRLYAATTRLQLARQSPIQLRLEENVLRLDENDRTVNGTSSFLATQVATLQSRDLAERVIRSQRLAVDEAFLQPGPARPGLLAVSGRLLALLRPRGWETSFATAPTREEGGATLVDAALVDQYVRYLKVGEVRGTDLVEIRFTTPSPQLSAFLAAAHTQAYMEANEEARRATDVMAKDFLARQLDEARGQLEQAEAALGRFAAANPDVAINQEQKVSAQRISELSTLVTKAEGQRVTLESRHEFLRRPTSEPFAYFLDRPGVQKLHLARLELQAQRAALAARLGPNHPQMIELRQQDLEVGQQLQAEVARESAAVFARYDAARLREEALREKLARQEALAIELRELGGRYDLLQKDVEGARNLHESLQRQQLQTAVNSELAAANLRVVERAEVPVWPSQPNIPRNLMMGVLAGLVLAAGAAFTCEYFDSSVKSSEEVEGLLQLPTLATIPNFALARRTLEHVGHATGNGANGHGTSVVVVSEPRSPAAEAFRSLRTAVLFSAPGAPPKVILVTSAGASEGKTVSSLNLAASLAESGSRVLLLDVDLRRPGCHRALGIDNDRGLSNFLAGQMPLAEVARSLEAPRVSFVSAGPTPPNPAELVGSTRMRDTLDELRKVFDFVILDCPPVLPVTDAVVLAREADGVVLVVKGHDTPRELVRRARDQLLQANVHLLGAVINNVDLAWGEVYFYNRFYGRYYAPDSAAPAERT